MLESVLTLAHISHALDYFFPTREDMFPACRTHQSVSKPKALYSPRCRSHSMRYGGAKIHKGGKARGRLAVEGGMQLLCNEWLVENTTRKIMSILEILHDCKTCDIWGLVMVQLVVLCGGLAFLRLSEGRVLQSICTSCHPHHNSGKASPLPS